MTQKHDNANNQVQEILWLYVDKIVEKITKEGVDFDSELNSVGFAREPGGEIWKLVIPDGMKAPEMDLEIRVSESERVREKIADNLLRRQQDLHNLLTLLGFLTEESSGVGQAALEFYSQAQGGEEELERLTVQIELLTEQLPNYVDSCGPVPDIRGLQEEVRKAEEALGVAQRDLWGFEERLERLLLSGMRKRRRKKLDDEVDRERERVRHYQNDVDRAKRELQQAEEIQAKDRGRQEATHASRRDLEESIRKLEQRRETVTTLLDSGDAVPQWIAENKKERQKSLRKTHAQPRDVFVSRSKEPNDEGLEF